MTGSPVPADLAPLAFLLGTWEGDGHGSYATISDFDYHEEITFEHAGKPFLAYRQRTWDADPEEGTRGRPLHVETGYWRPGGPGRVEVMIAQPTGVVELQEGTLAGTSIHLHSTSVACSATAKDVRRVERVLTVDGDEMHYRLLMTAVGRPHHLHLEARLGRRAPQP